MNYYEDVLIEQSIILIQIIFIDIILAADNAIIIGLIAASFVPKNRKQIILWGVAGALIFKVIFAIFAKSDYRKVARFHPPNAAVTTLSGKSCPIVWQSSLPAQRIHELISAPVSIREIKSKNP